jgi:AcrR family transcriptional regulator
MKQINEKLAADLLEAGRREFLARGFQGAALRNIAGTLGVTTGAIYRYYADKESLFDALVERPARELVERYRAAQQSFSELPLEQQLDGLPRIAAEERNWMIEYIYDHFEAFKLIVCCSSGTRYEHYIDVLVEIEENAGRVLIDRLISSGRAVRRLDDEFLHIVANALFSGMFETVAHDMPLHKAISYMDNLRDFYAAGWFKILGI